MAGNVRNGRVTGQVRYKGVSIAQTFETKTLAGRWITAVKAAIDAREWPRRDLIPAHLLAKWGFADEAEAAVDESKPHPGWTLGRALTHYLQTVTEGKKGYQQEAVRIAWWRKQELAAKALQDVTPEDLQAHVGRRLAEGRANNTVRNEVFLLSALFETARGRPTKSGWGLALENPVPHIELPPPPPGRKRRLEDARDDSSQGEEERMLAALRTGTDGTEMEAIAILAIDTGMRLFELLDIRVGQVKRTRDGRYVERPDSKNGHPRRVVLTTRAAATIDALLAALPADAEPGRRLLHLDTKQVDYRWRKARRAAGIKGLHFHDLRHEGVSRMAEKGLTIGELGEQSGHRSAQVLLRYVNARVSEVSRKLG